MVSTPTVALDVQLEMFQDQGSIFGTSRPSLVLQAVLRLNGQTYDARIFVEPQWISDTKTFDYGAEAPLSKLFVEILIPQLIAALKDEYTEAVLQRKIRPFL